MNTLIDLRSDTITKPTKGMLEAMFKAEVGDDVLGDDPTVKELETKVAEMFGMEAALFGASGTMTNQLALACHMNAGDEVICHKLSHIHIYEGGGIASNAFAAVKLLEGEYGLLTAEAVEAAINPDDIHFPVSKVVSLENTMNKGGGAYYDFEEILKIKEVCQRQGLILHLDGARLFNALAETSQTPQDYGKVFDSISICFSKGLGCPVGSMLLGSNELIKKAKRKRKVWGGGWRQAGYLAAAVLYALEHNVPLLKEDHRKAQKLKQLFEGKEWVKKTYPVKTNIIIVELKDTVSAASFVSELQTFHIKASIFGPQLVRFVTHLNFTEEQLQHTIEVLDQLKF